MRGRGNKTESLREENLRVQEGLSEDLRKPPRGSLLFCDLVFITSVPFRFSEGFQKFSWRRLSDLLPLIVLPLSLSPKLGGGFICESP